MSGESQWQPIETAPKDGTSFLACNSKVIDWYQVVFYDDENPSAAWAVADGPNYHQAMFTHWMPLPDPPPEPHRAADVRRG